MTKEKLNILLIDDDRDEYTLFNETLSRLNFDYNLTYCINSLDEVYYELMDKDFDLVFLDINLPGESGIKFLKKIKSKARFKEIPVIMYTVSSYDKDIEECYQAGAHHYLVKPHTENNLLESLRIVLNDDWAAKPANSHDFVINVD